MSSFTDRAAQILEAAEAAAARGECCSELTFLIESNGALRMMTDSDWPLESLMREHGARSVYRVTVRNGLMRVEGCEPARTCVLETRRAAPPGATSAQGIFRPHGLAPHLGSSIWSGAAAGPRPASQ